MSKIANLARPVVRATGVFIKTDEIIVELQRGILVARLRARPSEKFSIGYQDLFETLRQRWGKANAIRVIAAGQKARKHESPKARK